MSTPFPFLHRKNPGKFTSKLQLSLSVHFSFIFLFPLVTKLLPFSFYARVRVK